MTLHGMWADGKVPMSISGSGGRELVFAFYPLSLSLSLIYFLPLPSPSSHFHFLAIWAAIAHSP